MLWNEFAKVVANAPDVVALREGSKGFTFRQVEANAGSLSAALQQSGLKPGDRAALFIPNDSSFVFSVLALFHAGAVCLPLNTKCLEKELSKYLDDADPRLVLTDAAGAVLIRKVGIAEPKIILVEDLILKLPPGAAATGEATDPVLLQYSTGSTGQAKPVQRTQAQVLAEVRHYAEALHLGPSDRILGVVPLFHSHGFFNCMLAALYCGGCLVVSAAFRPRETLQILRDERITVFPSVPFMCKMVASLNPAEGVQPLKDLRLCFTAGAPLEPEISQGFQDRFGLPVRQLYGTTETGSISVNFDGAMPDSAGSVGLPMPGVEIAIQDEFGQPVPQGEIGELGVKSPAMAPEYRNSPSLTSTYYRGGFFFPGDVGLLDPEGRIHIKGRKTRFINVGGNKVDPVEVETYLATHVCVREVVVVGSKTEFGGELVKAFVVLNEPIDKEKLLEFGRQGLADFKAPKVLEFIEYIPRSPLGKVLIKYLE